MKPRHASALAVIYWCLMTPPFTYDQSMKIAGVDKSAPKARWHLVTTDTYSSIDDCQAAQKSLGRVTQDQIDGETKQGVRMSNQMKSAKIEAAVLAKCIASNDPRLGGNY
jgi:hypothetical protein